MADKINSMNGRRALKSMGDNLKTARLKRRISIRGFAERIGASERTVIRLEQGDGGVSVRTLVMACVVLGELDRITGFLDPRSDNTGLLFDRKSLPKRIDRKRKPQPVSNRDDTPGLSPTANDDEGVGF